MPPINMPAAEVDIDEDLVRALLRAQHPDLADRSLAPAGFGWDNAIFRLGDDLAVRLPRRQLAVPLVEHEQRWLPELALRLPLAIPAPVRVGIASADYAWPWSVVPWFDGEPALVAPPFDLGAAADALGAFFAALHQPAPPDAPPNPFRGIPLVERDERTLDAIEHLDGVDRDELRAHWAAAVAIPEWNRPPVWLHGDPHPGNVLVHRGRVTAVIDFGDITSGDPATDLAMAWMLFPAELRPRFRAAAGAEDDLLWSRARGWALAYGIVLSAHAADNPSYAALGERALAAVLADDA